MPLDQAIEWQRENYPEKAARLQHMTRDVRVAVQNGPGFERAHDPETLREYEERLGGEIGARAAPGSVVVLPTDD